MKYSKINANRFVLFLAVLCIGQTGLAQNHRWKAQLIFSEDFGKSLDTSLWKTEIAPLPESRVYTEKGRLLLDTKGGSTVWLAKNLKGNIRIDYVRTVIMDGGANDRLSDLNTFWMASDPRSGNLFTRSGVFEQYDSLKMYYVGMGGNSNRTTRFRKYQGNGEKTLLKEYRDTAHLLLPNKVYHITIELMDGTVRYLVNGKIYFEYRDPSPLKEGYFGFRTTKSRQAVDWIRVYRLRK